MVKTYLPKRQCEFLLHKRERKLQKLLDLIRILLLLLFIMDFGLFTRVWDKYRQAALVVWISSRLECFPKL